jgi:hypothetical protein
VWQMSICRWTDEETDDHVLGSGASWTFDWYAEAYGTPTGYVFTMLDPENTDPMFKDYTFTRGKVRTIVTQLMIGTPDHNVVDYLVQYLKNDDPDAAIMDCVIQICAYGKVIFSAML